MEDEGGMWSMLEMCETAMVWNCMVRYGRETCGVWYRMGEGQRYKPNREDAWFMKEKCL